MGTRDPLRGCRPERLRRPGCLQDGSPRVAPASCSRPDVDVDGVAALGADATEAGALRLVLTDDSPREVNGMASHVHRTVGPVYPAVPPFAPKAADDGQRTTDDEPQLLESFEKLRLNNRPVGRMLLSPGPVASEFPFTKVFADVSHPLTINGLSSEQAFPDRRGILPPI